MTHTNENNIKQIKIINKNKRKIKKDIHNYLNQRHQKNSKHDFKKTNNKIIYNIKGDAVCGLYNKPNNCIYLVCIINNYRFSFFKNAEIISGGKNPLRELAKYYYGYDYKNWTLSDQCKLGSYVDQNAHIIL